MIPDANGGEGEGGGGMRRSTFDPSSFDFGNTSRVFGIPEVEMSTPIKAEQPKEEASWYGIEPSQASVEQEEAEEPRKVASGAVRREMRKREGGGAGSGGLRRKGSAGASLRNGNGGGLRRRDRERDRERSESEEEDGSEEGRSVSSALV